MKPTRRINREKKSEVCRICLSAKNDIRIPIHADSEWIRLLEYCLGISVNTVSGPQILCDSCSRKLKDFSDFKNLALKSETLWNNVLMTEIKKDPVDVEIIHIKDEDEDSLDNDDDTPEYLDASFLNDEEWLPTDEIKDQEEEDEIKDDIDFSKNNIDDETEIQTRKSKKLKKNDGNVSKSDLKDLLTITELKKKYFDAVVHKKKKKYSCLKCGKELSNCKSIPLHVQKCYESEVLIVKKPNNPERTQKQIEEAGKIAPLIFDCGLCDYHNSDEAIVKNHVNEVHCLTNDLNCKVCDFKGRDMADVITHRFSHMPKEYKVKYSCPTCKKVSLNLLSLQFHYRSVHLKKPGGWCSVCSKTFTGYTYFRNHTRLHTDEKIYICDICGHKFLFRNLIVAHIREHMNVRNYICDTCGKSFKRNNALSGHIRAYHTELKPVPCDHCNKTFKNAYSLKLHMKMVKKGKNFVCEVCCKGYATYSLLKKHVFWHTGERPFECETCGGKYKSKGNLKLHMRKHMGIYPYKCESCGKPFMTSTQLKAHSSVHTGVRRVKCLVCERTFHEKRQMLAHCHSKHESYMLKYENQGTLANTEVSREVDHNIDHNNM